MELRSDGIATKKRILSSCVKLFLEKGYQKTTLRDVYADADVGASSFNHYFHGKDGVLLELEEFLFSSQFDTAGKIGKDLPPVYIYAIETGIQLAVTELNEQIRDCYIETYTGDRTKEFLRKNMAPRLYRIFGPYQPELTEEDFYHLGAGSAGLMRGFMAEKCDEAFSLEQKIRDFLTMTLRGYKVPEEEIRKVIGLIGGLDIRGIAQKVMQGLFRQLSVKYEFSLDEVLEGSGAEPVNPSDPKGIDTP